MLVCVKTEKDEDEGQRCRWRRPQTQIGANSDRDVLLSGAYSVPGQTRCRGKLGTGANSVPGQARYRDKLSEGQARYRGKLGAGASSAPGQTRCRGKLGAGANSVPVPGQARHRGKRGKRGRRGKRHRLSQTCKADDDWADLCSTMMVTLQFLESFSHQAQQTLKSQEHS